MQKIVPLHAFLNIIQEKMNYKHYVLGALLFAVSFSSAFAGGYLTNTNQHISFLRMVARGATSDIDAVYSNPAGLVWNEKNGWEISFNIQNAAQQRNIDATYSVMDYIGGGKEDVSKFYKGKASAPILPSLFATYKKDRLVFSGAFAVVGGGGKASYDDGLPMFDSAIRFGLTNNSKLAQLKSLTGAKSVSDLYDLNTAMNGAQFIYGVQLGVSYRITDWLSAYLGGRMNYFTGGYDGYVHAVIKEPYAQYYQAATGATDRNLYNLELDCDQTGWGLTPILGLSAKYKKLTVGMKYEFLTNLNLENKTTKNTDPDGALAAFKHGVNTPSDVPAILSMAAGYDILPTLRGTLEYHHYFDQNAGMANDKQKYVTHGTNEYALGVEWDVHKYVTVSAGGQITDYGLSDNFQTDTSFSCDSYSIGFGAKLNLSKHAKVNIAYFWTTYDDYTKNYTSTTSVNGQSVPSVTGTNVYKRTNKVFGLGLDYAF